MNLEKKIDKFLKENPERYSDDSVERVMRFIDYETLNPKSGKKPYRFLETIDDFVLYYQVRNELHGKSAYELENGTRLQRLFYAALQRKIRSKIKSKNKRKEIIRSIIPQKYEDRYGSFKRLDEWVNEFKKHKGWKGKTPYYLAQDKKKGGQKFYGSFMIWLLEHYKSEAGRKKAKRKIFAPRYFWSNFETFEDWKGYHRKHKDWKGKSFYQLKKEKSDGANFYNNYRKWINQNIKSEAQREGMIARLFPRQHYWSSLKTIDDWIRVYEKNERWTKMSKKELKKDRKTKGSSFYYSFIRWANRNSKNEAERKDLVGRIISNIRRDWSSFTKLEDWKGYHRKHKDWKGKTSRQIRYTSKEGSEFYYAFKEWARKNSRNVIHREKMKCEVYDIVYENWKLLKTIDDWKDYLKEQPELNGKTIGYVCGDKKYGGRLFYHAFRGWVAKNAKDDKEDVEFTLKLFPQCRGPFLYDFGKQTVKFDSYNERIVGMLLNKYGLIKDFKKNKNIHIYTHIKGQNSIDFLVGNTFIEFHPVSRKDKREGRKTPAAAGKYKRDHITKPEYLDKGFWHMDEVEQLHDVLMSNDVNPLMRKRYRNLTFKQFEKDIDWAYKKAADYDARQDKKAA